MSGWCDSGQIVEQDLANGAVDRGQTAWVLISMVDDLMHGASIEILRKVDLLSDKGNTGVSPDLIRSARCRARCQADRARGPRAQRADSAPLSAVHCYNCCCFLELPPCAA